MTTDLWAARRKRAKQFLSDPPKHRQPWASRTYSYDTATTSQDGTTGTEDEKTSKDTDNADRGDKQAHNRTDHAS